MKFVQADELPKYRALPHRAGTIYFRDVMEGEPGTPGNFQLTLAEAAGDFYSPRHRHNFEQIRFCLDGDLDFSKTGKLTAGMVGYFPEGVSYGPQTQKPDNTSLALVLQFGGASGSGYLSRGEAKAATEELKKQGEFVDGVFRRNADVPGKRNMDGFQAIWEYANRRPMVYPKPRYDQPMFMDPAAYDWAAVDGMLGVAEKLLGVFTERRAEQRFLKIQAGTNFILRGRAIYVALSGTGTASGQTVRRLTTVYLDAGETTTLAVGETMELFQFGLPNLAGLKAAQPLSAAAE